MNPNVVRFTLIQGGLEAQALSLSQNGKTNRLTGSYQDNDFLLEFGAGKKPYDSLRLIYGKRDVGLESALAILMDYLPFADYQEEGLRVTEWDKHPKQRFSALKKEATEGKIQGLSTSVYYLWLRKRNGRK